MILLLISILALALAAGQLIKIPIGTQGGITLLDITVALFCFFGLFKLKFNLRKPPLPIIAALIFAIIALVSIIFTPLNLSNNEYIISTFYTLRFLLYVTFAWLVFSSAFGGLKENLNSILLIAGVSFAFLGLGQLIFFPNLDFLTNLGWDPHYFRTVSTFLDPNFAGAFFVLTLLLIYSSKVQKDWQNKLFFILVYLALLTTFSRSSYLAFLVSFIILAFLKKSFKLAILTIILSGGLLIGFSQDIQVIAQPRGIDRTGSAISRLKTWEQGIIIFQNHPILGIGFNAYRYALKEYRLGDEEFLSTHGASTNDSSLLFVAATTGTIGLTSFLFFLSSMLFFSKKNYILIAGLCGLIIQSFFINALFYPPLLLWLLLNSIRKDA